MTRGWLLDLHPSGRDEVLLWNRDEGGRIFSRRVRWRPRLYVAGPFDRLVELGRLLSSRYEVDFVEKSVKPGAEPRMVLEVKVPIGRKGRLARFILDIGNHQTFQVYNVDLPPMQEYLYQHDLYPTALIEFSEDGFKALDSIEDLDYELGWLRVVYLDAGIRASGPFPRFKDPLSEVSVECGEDKIALDGSEAGILEDLTKVLDDLDADIIITDGGDSFLIPYLHYRARVNGVELRLGRFRDPKRLRVSSSSHFSYGRIHRRYRGFRLRGRLHIDASNSMLYGEAGLDGVVEVARTARIPIQDAARYTIGTCMSSLQYYQAYRLGILLPRRPAKPIYMNGRQLNRADRGGWILDAKIGLHWNVGELDFKSLYPMLMLKHNISGETLNCECCREDGERVPELGYHVCRRWRGIVPRAIELPLGRRLEYKRLHRETGDPVYKRRADALKWVLVTAFGYLGFRKAKFGSREAHMAVCAYARETLLKAVRIAEEMGFEVIHGIVDSLWVKREGAGDEDYRRLAEAIEERLGHPVSYEGRYRWIAFLPSRLNPLKPVNNRYYGVFTDGRIKYRGIEARRRDTPPIVREMQLEILGKLAEAREPEELGEKALEAVEIYRRYARRLILGEVSIEDLAITHVLSMHPEDYSVKARQAVAAKHLQRAGIKVAPGQAVTYVIADPSGPYKAVPAPLLKEGSYSVEQYLSMLQRAASELIDLELPKPCPNLLGDSPYSCL